jgi:hypothetical protein
MVVVVVIVVEEEEVAVVVTVHPRLPEMEEEQEMTLSGATRASLKTNFTRLLAGMMEMPLTTVDSAVVIIIITIVALQEEETMNGLQVEEEEEEMTLNRPLAATTKAE